MVEKNATERLSSYNPVTVGKNQTRDCLDPWTFMQILSGNNIRPCCFSEVVIGTLKKEDGGLEGALHSEASIKLRKGLLTGDLDQFCAICSYKPMIETKAFQEKIAVLVGIKKPAA